MDPVAVLNGLTRAATTIRDLVTANATAEVLRERLGLAADRLEFERDRLADQLSKLQHLEAELAKAHEELLQAQKEVAVLRKAEEQHLARRAAEQQFKEIGDVLARRNPDGTWSGNAYCPECHGVLSDMGGMLSCAKHSGFIASTRAGVFHSHLEVLRRGE